MAVTWLCIALLMLSTWLWGPPSGWLFCHFMLWAFLSHLVVQGASCSSGIFSAAALQATPSPRSLRIWLPFIVVYTHTELSCVFSPRGEGKCTANTSSMTVIGNQRLRLPKVTQVAVHQGQDLGLWVEKPFSLGAQSPWLLALYQSRVLD